MTTTYLNPVHPEDVADPFVLQHEGEFWAYGTGIQADGGCFGVYHSHDLVHWQKVGSAMAPLPGDHPCYWAPEVTYAEGLFYLYYSVGDEATMQIRVATARHPAGPFEDSGHCLTHEPFAIDAHLFVDEDGTRYLFYATDFLEHERVGTGTVRDRMLDPFTLAGDPQPVTRACFDWQIYDPNRAEKGGVRWHTIEGSFVLRHKGRYYQMFSGGNWQNPSYGVSYATTDDITRPGEWEQHCDGEAIVPLLRSVAGQVVGPGHNSVVRGPDNRQLFCVYHRWAADGSGRWMAIDRLEWVGPRLEVLGPSSTPQPLPLAPTFLDRFDAPHADGLGPAWDCTGGHWRTTSGKAEQPDPSGAAEARCLVALSDFVAEVSVTAGEGGGPDAGVGLRLYGDDRCLIEWRLLPAARQIAVGPPGEAERFPLPDSFDVAASHRLRMEVAHGQLRLQVDEAAFAWSGRVARAAEHRLALFTENTTAAFGHVALTEGWEESWEGDALLDARGWQGDGAWRIEGQTLRYAPTEGGSTLRRGPLLREYELVVNVRLDRDDAAGPAYTLLPALSEDGTGPRLSLVREGEGWVLHWQADEERHIPLPPTFDPLDFRHFRLWKARGRLTLRWGATPLAEFSVPDRPTRIGVAGHGGPVTFDLIRVTRIMDGG